MHFLTFFLLLDDQNPWWFSENRFPWIMISMFTSFVDNLTSPLMIGESKKKSSNWSEDYILKISEETHMGMLLNTCTTIPDEKWHKNVSFWVWTSKPHNHKNRPIWGGLFRICYFEMEFKVQERTKASLIVPKIKGAIPW